eukprot:TRINITY_DN11052_c0_g1_i1.p1 TRINITY_DN11052_c0_g1~~TRINITY_DN11052_c0_g1_i1.p1  ORF type:complete len:493 (-),score=122.63 TRINITY_DN11052_c0_g1_i1:118-1596(-)
MVEVLGPSLHQESFPPEIDVYRIPHNRMKQLVTSVIQILPEIQESLNFEQAILEKTLQVVYTTMWELKTHEIIENTVIMNKLKERLHSRKVYNQFVCNCHEDSDLVKIIDLVELVYSSSESNDRTFYWQKLQEAIYEFLDDFLPHMEEEENIFQPLLNEYFDYDELKQIKDTVLTQHKEWKVKVDAEKSLKHFKRSHEGHEENKEENKDTYCQEVFKTVSLESVTENLPDEILHEIFSYITDPRDFGRASMVCQRWNSISKTLQFWKNLPLSQWERGIWTFRNVDLYDILLADKSGEGDYSEPAVYDAILELLPEVGNGTRTLSVSGSKCLTNTQMKKILKNVPGLVELDCSYTNICHISFNDPSIKLHNLEKLDMSGCRNVTDLMIELMVKRIKKEGHSMKWLSLSGCELLTDKCLAYLETVSSNLECVDFSGCYRMSGIALKQFTDGCKNLKAEFISYCNILENGPDPLEANGCNNSDCDIRQCCLNYKN